MCNPKYLLGSILAVMAVIAFNIGQPGIETNTAAAFNAWYQATAPKLSPSGDFNESDLPLRITVTLTNSTLRDTPTVWNVPLASLRDPQERENAGRVLQLIRESGIFGFTPLRNPTSVSSVITLSIRDGDEQFETSVPFRTVEGNIQLQNLLKLLDIYSTQTGTPHVEPARL